MNPKRHQRIRAASDDPIEEMVESLVDSVDSLVEGLGKKHDSEPPDGSLVVPKWLVRMLVGMAIVSFAGGFWAAVALDQRVDFIERTRSTSQDDARLEERMRNYHDSRTPPPEVRAKDTEHDRRLDALNERVRVLERR